MGLNDLQPENMLAPCKDLKIYSRGMGALGLPGDWSSSSRFVRAVFVKEKIAPQAEKEKEVFFEILKSVSVPRGCVKSENGENVGTIYTSCMDMMDFKYYYYKTGDNAMQVLRFR